MVIGTIVIAAALGFDDVELSNYQLEYGRLLATFLGGAAVLISALRYIWERQQELAWRRTEFMAGLFREFEDRREFRRAQSMIDVAYESEDQEHLARVLGPIENLSQTDLRDRIAIDRYLDFFDHLFTYTFVTRTISADEAISFSGYVIDVLDSPPASDFCFEMGYEDVLRLALYYRDRAVRLKRSEETQALKEEVLTKRKG